MFGIDIESRSNWLREAALLAGLALAAFCVRWYYTRYHPVMVPDYDGAEYVTLARNLLSGHHSFTTLIPPGLPVLIAGALPLFREPQSAGMFVSAAAGAMLCVSVYLFTAELFDKKTAFFAGVMTAFFGNLIVLSTWVMSEMPYAFLLFTGLYAGLVFRRRGGLGYALAFGAAFGLGYLVRPEAFIFFVGSAALLLTFGLSDGNGRRRLLAGLAVSVVSFAVFCVPYIVYIERTLDRFSISGKVRHNIAVSPADEQAALEGGTVAYVKQNAGPLVRKYGENLRRMKGFLPRFLPLPLALLAALGMAVSAFWGKTRPLGLVFPMMLVAYVLLLPFFFVDQRILGPYYPVPLIWAAAFVSFVQEKLAAMPMLTRAMRFYPLSVLLALALALHNVSYLNRYFNSPGFRFQTELLKSRYVKTGQWLAERTTPADKVMARELMFVFYSGRDYVRLPDAPPEKVLELAREQGARYVVVDDVCIRKAPALGPLLGLFQGSTPCASGFRWTYINTEAGVLIYEVEGRV